LPGAVSGLHGIAVTVLAVVGGVIVAVGIAVENEVVVPPPVM